MYEGYQVPYHRPGTGKVGNPYLQAHASPPVRRHDVRRGNMLKRRVSQGTLRRRGSASAALEEEAVKGPPRDLAKAREVARELAGGKVEKGLPWEGALSSSRPDKSIASPIQPLVSLETEFLRANAIFSHGP
ncbi:hypothetical protein BHM03_00027060 [Ensete ventricosum]|nr:hypothetical protein BHM03_00027060 [Ensete ventricosum]